MFANRADEENQNPTNAPEKPTNVALDRLLQLACAMQRCVVHANCAPGAKKQICVRIGIATGPAVVGFYGLQQPFPYNCWGWTVDEARRLELNAASGAILLEESAYESASKSFSFEPQAAVGAIRGGDMAKPLFDYSLIPKGSDGAADSSYTSIEARSSSQDEKTGTEKVATKRKPPRAKAKKNLSAVGAAGGGSNEKLSMSWRSDSGVEKENLQQKKIGGGGHWSKRAGMKTKSIADHRVPLRDQIFRDLESTESLNLSSGSVGRFSAKGDRRSSGSWLPAAVVHTVASTDSMDALTTFAEEIYTSVKTPEIFSGYTQVLGTGGVYKQGKAAPSMKKQETLLCRSRSGLMVPKRGLR